MVGGENTTKGGKMKPKFCALHRNIFVMKLKPLMPN
jgi:hypothetical protein